MPVSPFSALGSGCPNPVDVACGSKCLSSARIIHAVCSRNGIRITSTERGSNGLKGSGSESGGEESVNCELTIAVQFRMPYDFWEAQHTTDKRIGLA